MVLAALCLTASFVAHGACDLPGKIGRDPLNQILTERMEGCFGEEQDKNPLTVRVRQIKQCSADQPADVHKLRQNLSHVAADLDAESLATFQSASEDWQALGNTMLSEMMKAKDSLAKADSIAAPAFWDWGSSGHNALQRGDGVFAIDYEPIVKQECPADAATVSTKCAAAIHTAVRVNRVVQLSHYVHQCASQSRLEKTLKALAVLDSEWDYYFFKTRSQYVWELAINSWRFQGKDDVFAPPPSDQLIVVHPGVAFEFVGSSAQQAESYQATLFAEVIGYNRFKWKPGNDGSPSSLPPLGVALVVTYTPDNIGEHVGYGVMFHVYNTLSLGVTQRDTGAGNELTYLLSADLMRLILNPTPEAIAKFRGKGAAVPAQE
jgi:hypothetical protein